MVTFDMWMVGIGVALLGTLFWRSRHQRRAGQRFGLVLTDDLEVAAHLALHLAKTRSHRRVGVLHLAYALLQDEAASGLLGRLGLDVAALEGRLEQLLDEIPGSRSARLTANLTLEAEASLRNAAETGRSTARDSETVAYCDCAVALAHLLCGPTSGRPQDNDARRLIAAVQGAGLDAGALVYAVAHGERESPSEAIDETECTGSRCVVLHNDDFTPIDMVIELLTRELHIDPSAAAALTVRAHREGRAECGRWPAREAHHIAGAIMAGARAANYPLRVSVR